MANDSETVEYILNGIRSVSGRIDPSVIQKSIDNWKNVPVFFGVVGETNSGKSSFINAIRGLNDDDKEAAKVDVMECTGRPQDYHLPGNKNITVTDLPGVGTSNHLKEKYLESIEVDKFDILLIVSCGRLKEHDSWLANELKKRNKKFYFIRTKIDQDIANDKRDNPRSHNPVEVTRIIKENVSKNLAEQKIDCPVFLVSNHERDKYDLMNVLESICSDCDEFKADAIVQSFNNIYSKELLDKKRKALKKRIWKAALLSAGATAIPIPGTGLVADIAVITEEILHYRSVLGLTGERIRKAANMLGKSEEDITDGFSEISFGVVYTRVIAMSASIAATVGFKTVLKNVLPFIGVILAPVSYATTSALLLKALDAIYEDAVKLHHLVSIKPVEARIKREIKLKKDVKVVIIGRTGSGKSSLINAFRGIESSHEKAAKVGVVETTTESVEYEFEDYKGVTLVDTPGIGTQAVSRNSFQKLVKLKEYDIVIVCMEAEIYEDDEWLLKTASKLNKPTILVRTKVSQDIESYNKKRATPKSPKKIAKEIKIKHEAKVNKLGLEEVKVYLIDNKDEEKFEFEDLKDYLLDTCCNIEPDTCVLQ